MRTNIKNKLVEAEFKTWHFTRVVQETMPPDITPYDRLTHFGSMAFEAGFELAIKAINFHKGRPDGDAEILGYPDGKAPTRSSEWWAFINMENGPN